MNYWIPLLILFSFISAFADDIHGLSDEFTSSVTQSQWTQLNDTEGWNANQLELWALNPGYEPGHMVMAPHSSAWFMDLRGVLVYKEITGDFVVTMGMRVSRRGVGGTLPGTPGFTAQAGAPNRQFSLAGIFIRNPRVIAQAAPDPAPAGVPSWPPPGDGQSGHYTTDWTPDGDNYIFLSYGSAGNQGNWQYEVKTTRNGNSRLYYNSHGVPSDDSLAQYVTLQLIRINDTVVTLRKHDDGPWIVENRYTPSPASPYQQLPNFGDTLQVGVTTYTDWNSIGSFYAGGNHATQYQHNYTVFDGPGHNPDLIAHVDYYRFQRPDPALTEAGLLALPITFSSAPLGGTAAVELPNTGVGIYLGAHANISAPGFDQDSDGDGLLNLLEAVLGTSPVVPNGNPLQVSMDESHFQLNMPYRSDLDSVLLELQTSTSLAPDSWVTVASRSSAGWSVDPPYQVIEEAGVLRFMAPLAGGDNFYRVQISIP